MTTQPTQQAYIECPPNNVCAERPCRHDYCRDPDWLADMEDACSDREFFRTLWSMFGRLCKGTIDSEDAVKYKDKLERCQRITDKGEQIRNEITASFFRNVGINISDLEDLTHGKSREEMMEMVRMKLQRDLGGRV
jgi:hypothetical protein